MLLHPVRLLLALVLTGGLVSTATAQLPETRSLFKEPKTPAEFFSRMKFEMELGNYAVAAQYLRGLITLNPSDKDLVDLEKAEGTTTFLKLRTIPRWVPAPPEAAPEATRKAAETANDQAKKDIETLIQRVTEAVRKNLNDPERIQRYVNRLSLGKEEYEYAMGELYRSGAAVVPYIIDELRTADGERRVALLRALTQFGPEANAPMIAALDSNLTLLQFDLVAVLRQRGALEAVPSLFWMLGNTVTPPNLKTAVREALVYFTRTPADRLPSPRAALTQEAERYYQHKVQFADPKAVVVWRWDNDRVLPGFKDQPTISASKAEEYYATRYATQALALDPAYEPAQQVLISLILDKNYEETGIAKPLAQSRPDVFQRLSTVNPDMLTSVLERALKDKRPAVIIGALRLLGAQGEVKANLPGPGAQPPLVQALNYPDARVQFIAAETQLKMPGVVPPNIAVRVVDIFKRALSADAVSKQHPRIVVGYNAEDRVASVAGAVRQMGYDPVVVRTGRAGIRRLQEGADIDALLIDADLPDPGLPNFLAQIKADRNARNLPVFLTAEPKSYDRWRFYTEKNPQIRLFPIALIGDPLELRAALQGALESPEHKPLSAEEIQDHAERAIKALALMARKEIPGYDVRPADMAVYDVLRSGRLSPQGASAAIQVIGTLTGSRPQPELLAALANATAPNEVRIAAAETLVRHIQQFGLLLRPAETATIAQVSATPNLDPGLRSAITALLGTINRNPRLSGERLQGYQPRLGPEMPMKEKEKEKE